MKYFVSGDIHGFFDEGMTALDNAGFDINNKEHCIILCGDLLDRGNKPKECLRFINDLHRQGRAIMIKGNHEDLLEDVFRNKFFNIYDESNGTLKTCELISGVDVTGWGEEFYTTSIQAIDKTKDNPELKYYLDNVIDFYELGDYVFVHGGIPIEYEVEDDPEFNLHIPTRKTIISEDWRNGDGKEARWKNGMYEWSEGNKLPGKTIVCGHWHTSWGHCHLHNDGFEFLNNEKCIELAESDPALKPHFETFKDDGIIAVDGCIVVSRIINVEVIDL